MKKIFKSLIVTVLFASLFAFVKLPNAQALTLKQGDILITNQTQCKGSKCKGITGHAGIVVKANGSLKVLHIPGKSPGKEQIRIDSISTFYSNYHKKIKVVRPNSSSLGAKAANKALYYFSTKSKGKTIGKKWTYRITSNPKNISKTYCSEIVWYSYYKAGKTFKEYAVVQTSYESAIPPIITPDDFLHHASNNGFKIIDNKY